MRRVVSYSLLNALSKCADVTEMIMEHPSEAMQALAQLRHPKLFKDSLIMSLGPWGSPAYRKMQNTSPGLYDIAHAEYQKLLNSVLDAHNDVLEGAFDVDATGGGNSIMNNLEIKESLREIGVNFEGGEVPTLFSGLYEADVGLVDYITGVLDPIMDNYLNLDHSGRKSGEKDTAWEQYFLCSVIDDIDLPWDESERDW